MRVPQMVGEGRAMDLMLTGRLEDAKQALRIGLSEYTVPQGQALQHAEPLALQISEFPRSFMLADRRSLRGQHRLTEAEALRREWFNSRDEVLKVGVDGARRFAEGAYRGGLGV
ncbi:MAG: hypothetical protein ACPGSC_14555 [Granulosicoccaceae bacterium]